MTTGANEIVYLGLGSNMGDREANLHEAVDRIERLGLVITRLSSIYETEPVGYSDQPWFLNQVIEARVKESDLQPLELLRALLDIELRMGRRRGLPDGPRVIDIDLLIYRDMEGPLATTDETTSARAELTVPHPRMHLRRFVLEPLCEIAPDLVHPVAGKTCRDLLAELDDPSTVRRQKAESRRQRT